MTIWLEWAIFGLLGIIAYKILSVWMNQMKYRIEAAQRGCQPAPTLRSNNLLGTSRLTESIRATREDRGPQYVISAMNELGDELGKDVHTMRVPILDYELLVTRDPENVKAMLSTQSQDYDISSTRSNAFMPLLGEGVFTSRGNQWKHSRALVRPQFQRDEVTNLEFIERHVRTLLAVLGNKIGENNWTHRVDLQPLFFYFTLDTATEFLYGQSVGSQASIANGRKTTTGIDGAAFSRNLDAAKHFVDKRGALGKFYWLFPHRRQMNQHCKEIHEVVDGMIQYQLNSKRNPLSSEEKGNRKFVLLDELAKETKDLSELRNETLHTLAAGRDPTASLLGWTFYMLARHPRVFDKLRSLVIEEFGDINSTSHTLDYNRLVKCDYMFHVLHEVLRIVAVIPMNERVALRNTTLPRGGGKDGSYPIYVRKGIQILIPAYAIQHRPDIWGEDVEEFRPERWETHRIGWEWIPFGGGPRKCLGRKSPLHPISSLFHSLSYSSSRSQPPS
jgi:cytochrome P450